MAGFPHAAGNHAGLAVVVRGPAVHLGTQCVKSLLLTKLLEHFVRRRHIFDIADVLGNLLTRLVDFLVLFVAGRALGHGFISAVEEYIDYPEGKADGEQEAKEFEKGIH